MEHSRRSYGPTILSNLVQERLKIIEEQNKLLSRLRFDPPEWALPLLEPARYKAIFGGRSSGKSHCVAELVVRKMVEDPDLRVVCIREIQKSLNYSAKALIENKIYSMGAINLFDIYSTEIRRRCGRGLCIFQGMQSHNADSIKSLEGFGLAWVEEARYLSDRSLSLLRPTIRSPGSEIWFTWNPEQPDDPVDKFFRGENGPPERSIVIRVNYDMNPFLPEESKEEMEIDKADPNYFAHVWLGEYNIKSNLQILHDKWKIDEFESAIDWSGPYYGADWGFANDPTTAVKLWIYQNTLFVEHESWAIGLELDQTAKRWMRDVPDIEKHTVRADCSRPETISYVSRHGIPYLVGAKKWNGSVEDGIEYLRRFDSIVVHPRCERFAEECRLYQWRTNSAGDILPEPLDKFNHCLAPETLVETINGPKRIDSIKPGEFVLTRKGYRRVIDAWISDRNVKTYKLKASTGHELIATRNHEIFANESFTRMDALTCNDTLTLLDSAAAHVLSITDHEILPEVWDLTVEDDHEFFANEILVHNCIDATRYALQPLIKDLGIYSEGQVTWSY